MTLVLADDRATFTAEHDERYALGPPEQPLLVLNSADALGCAWVAVVEGWEAPDVTTPIDRRPTGHGGYAGSSSLDPLVLTVEGTVTAPNRAALRDARDRLHEALLGDLTGFLRYSHLDEDPARGVWARITGRPRWTSVDDRCADFAFVLVAEDPVKTGNPFTIGPIRLASLAEEGGYALTGAGPLTAYSSTTLVETRRNRVPNPHAVGTTGWSLNAGTGGTATLSAPTTGGPDGGSHARSTYTVANSTAAGTNPSASIRADGRAASALPFPVTPGEVVSAAIQVRTSIAQRVMAAVWYFDASGGTAGISPSFVSGPIVNLTANAWTRLLAENLTVPAGAAYAMVGASTASGTGVVPFGVGATFDASLAQLETGATIGAYFDGAIADAPPVEYGWEGAANASPSVQQTASYSTAPVGARATVGIVRNEGNEPAPAVFRILAGSASFDDPLVQVSTGEYVHLALTLNPGDLAEVDTASGTVQVNGANRYDAWGPGSTFPLIPGRVRLPDGSRTPGGAEVRLRSLTGDAPPDAALYVDSVDAWR